MRSKDKKNDAGLLSNSNEIQEALTVVELNIACR